MKVTVEISVGEFFDKMTILEIKRSRIRDPAKRKNVEKELGRLYERLASLPFSREEVREEVEALKEVNEKLWGLEDEIRGKEARKEFGAAFIELARAVYRTNDKRFEIKRAIDRKLGSEIVEEKSYEPY